MDELEREFKRHFSKIPLEGALHGDPLWESQAWLLRTRMKFGGNIQQFWDTTQGQITSYAEKLNSEDQTKATSEAVETLHLALRTGFSACNGQMDGLLRQIFTKDHEEETEEQDSGREAPPSSVQNADLNIISLVDVVDEGSTQYRTGPDPPERGTREFEPASLRKKDPDASRLFNTRQEPPEVIDVTNDLDERQDASEVIDVLNRLDGATLLDDSDNASAGSGKISLTHLLLQTYLPNKDDGVAPEFWPFSLAAPEEPTMPVISYPTKSISDFMDLTSRRYVALAGFGSSSDAVEGREEGNAAAGRLGVDPIDLTRHGSHMEPIDLTMYERSL